MPECTFCKGNNATCHLTKIVNGKAVELHVCTQCIPELAESDLVDFDIWEAIAKLAEKKGMADPTQLIEPQPALMDELSAKSFLMNQVAGKGVCPSCGFTAEQLRKVGRLGCPDCYNVFGEMLADVISDCQKSTSHSGKIPESMRAFRRHKIEEELAEAVREERFEDAATLRDQLKCMSD